MSSKSERGPKRVEDEGRLGKRGRRAYEPPRLVNYGDVVEETLGEPVGSAMEKYAYWIETSF